MGKLQILPGNIANMIAAGEVVQRPASVVKELMENSVDAGATDVAVVVSDAGRTLIQVIDNGCGLSAADARLCFERHATSKIATAEDLQEILTYGFRGEALASIAAVAEVTLKTRRAEDEVGTQVHVEAFGQISSEEVSTPVGANFAVRNLFYNTPARRKFLKSDTVELKHIVEEFTRIALTRPEVAFSLTHNGRDLFALKSAKSLKYRVLDLLGSTIAEDIVDLSAQTSILKVSGFVGSPASARKTLGNQYLFVNGRFFRSAYLHKAVMKAYEEFIPEGVTPSYFIYLEVDPHTVDVNIHPTKTEVKFEEDSVIFQTLYACVKETLGKHAFGASIDFDAAQEPAMPVLGSQFDQYRPMAMPSAPADPTYDPFAPSEKRIQPDLHFDQYVERKQDYGQLFSEAGLPSAQALVLQGRFILSPVQSGLMIIHISRARERVLFDRFLRAIRENEHVVQQTLFPVQVPVGRQNKLVFDEHADLLESMGFDITPFGDDAIVFNGVPEGFSSDSKSVQEMAADLLLLLSDDSSSLPGMMASTLAERFARIGARGAALSSPYEAQRLIEALLACDNAEFTPGGHRIISIVPTGEIEKKF